MPIQAPTQITGAAASEFKDTTAAYRQTGPVEKYPPVSQALRESLLHGLGPIAPRVDELSKEGRPVTLATLRAAEIAAKIQKGGTELSPAEMAQAQIALKEALDAGFDDPNSPYYQADSALRADREEELQRLHDEVMGYLTGESRRPYTQIVRRRVLSFITGHNIIRTRTATPSETTPLIPPDTTSATARSRIAEAQQQSRILEGYQRARDRIVQERYGGGSFDWLNAEDKRTVTYTASEELSRQFADEGVKKIIEGVTTRTSRDLIDQALKTGSEAERRLAKRAQKAEEDREGLLRKTKDLTKVTKMADFQRLLVVDDTTLSRGEIADFMIQKMGLTDEREIARLKSDPDRAFEQFFQQASSLGTVVSVGELFHWKLEKFAEDRLAASTAGTATGQPEISPAPAPLPEREAGKPPENLSGEGFLSLTPEELAMQLADGKLTSDPVEYLKRLGISEATAKDKIGVVVDQKKFATKNGDGTYSLNPASYGEWRNEDLALLVLKGDLDLRDQAVADGLKSKMNAAMEQQFPDSTQREGIVDKRINDIQNLVAEIQGITRVNNPSQLTNDQKELLSKRLKKGLLGLLVLLAGGAFMTNSLSSLSQQDQRGLQNMFR